MAVEFYAFEMLTGRRLTPLPVSGGTWKLTVGADEQIGCTVPARSAVAKRLKIWETTALARSGLLVVVDGEPIAAGPLWKRTYAQGGDIVLTAGGLRSYYNRRLLLPVAARGRSLVLPSGDPDTALDVNLSGLSYGTIAKRWVQLAALWPGGNVPVMLPADETGTRERNISAIDLKMIGKLLDDLQDVINGPEVAFRPRFAADGLGIYWEMQTGTEARPWIGAEDASLIRWTVGAPTGGAFGLNVEEDGTGLAEEVFGIGGSSSDQVLSAQSRNPALSVAGTPLLQASDTSHGDVKLQPTLQQYVDQGANLGQYAASFWSMSVRAHEPATPKLGEFWLGDLATITIDKAEPVLPPGDFTRRIASVSGDALGESYALTFAEAMA